MISLNTNLILFIAMTLTVHGINGMQKLPYQMTIENQTYGKQYLNVENPNCLTDESPYAYVPSKERKTFLLTEENKNHQSIAFPNGHPLNKVNLPINQEKTHFIIKLQDEPGSPTKIVVTDEKGVTISSLYIVSNAQSK